MSTMIVQGIPVATDSLLSQQQIHQLVSELKQTWTWEGRKIGRIEMRCAGRMIHLLVYENPVLQCIPLNLSESEGKNS